jgi:uncharacterized protein
MTAWLASARAPFAALALILLTALTQVVSAAELRFPDLSGRVVDQAGLLSASARDRLTNWLAELERAKGYQVVVATVPSLQGVPIEDFGYRLGRAWGIGEAGRNTGALLIVAPTERTVRIEVGYGLEGTLTDAQSRAIIERDILPAFRSGSYEQGILAGTAEILRTLGFEPTDAPERAPQAPGAPESGGLGLLFFIGMILFIMFMNRRGGRRSRSILPYMLASYAAGSLGRSGRGSSGGGGSFGGGFRGGGGSFGGGGASGRW